MLGQWLGVSHRVRSALCYWILSEKGFFSQTTVQYLTAKEPRDPGVQERIRDYHGSLRDVLGSEYFGTILDGYDSLVNYYENGITKGDTNEEGYQVPPDSSDIDEIIYNSDEEREANSYDQYIGSEFVLLDWMDEKLMGKVVSKRVI